jgi:hypothetical protein
MPRSRSGTLGTLVLALLTAAGSLWLGVGSGVLDCNHLAPLTVLATVSAFVMALGFRLLARASTSAQRWQLAVALLLAAGTLFGDARFVTKYRRVCNQVERQFQQTTTPAAK